MRVLGLSSGTSVDGVDAALAELSMADDTLRIGCLGDLTVPWPDRLRERVLAAGTAGVAELCRLDRDLGVALGEVAAEALARLGPAELVASHGQTIHHDVHGGQVRGTLQFGQPAEIAERTGLPVVADFRVRDVAAGGQGAPLVSILDQLLLAGPTPAGAPAPVAALNLGGIANLTVVRPGQPTLAFDTGPGNALLDAAMARHSPRPDAKSGASCPAPEPAEDSAAPLPASERERLSPTMGLDTTAPWQHRAAPAGAAAGRSRGRSGTGPGARHPHQVEPYDAGGARTARGTADPALLEVLLADPYLAAAPPKSTGKERYHAGYLESALNRAPVARLEDLLATLAEFSAAAVAADAGRYQVRRVWASGGGVRNTGLFAALGRRLAEVGAELETTEALGLPVDAKEAYAFAVLGWLTWHGQPGTVPSCTGAAGSRILGAITPGAGPLRIPSPLPAPPLRAVAVAQPRL